MVAFGDGDRRLSESCRPATSVSELERRRRRLRDQTGRRVWPVSLRRTNLNQTQLENSLEVDAFSLGSVASLFISRHSITHTRTRTLLFSRVFYLRPLFTRRQNFTRPHVSGSWARLGRGVYAKTRSYALTTHFFLRRISRTASRANM